MNLGPTIASPVDAMISACFALASRNSTRDDCVSYDEESIPAGEVSESGERYYFDTSPEALNPDVRNRHAI